MSYIRELLPFPPSKAVIDSFPSDTNIIIKECADNQITLPQWESVSVFQ